MDERATASVALGLAMPSRADGGSLLRIAQDRLKKQ
jgi:hypothetical protein